MLIWFAFNMYQLGCNSTHSNEDPGSCPWTAFFKQFQTLLPSVHDNSFNSAEVCFMDFSAIMTLASSLKYQIVKVSAVHTFMHEVIPFVPCCFLGLATISLSAVTELLVSSFLTVFPYCSWTLLDRAEDLLFQRNWGNKLVETHMLSVPSTSWLWLHQSSSTGPQYRLKLYKKFLAYIEILPIFPVQES